MPFINKTYHVMTQSFFHLTLAHKFYIGTSNVTKISLETQENKCDVAWQN